MRSQLHSLPEHPLIWRASSILSASAETLATGYLPLDAMLPGKGWPAQGLIEILSECAGYELQLFAPLLRKLFAVEKQTTLLKQPSLAASRKKTFSFAFGLIAPPHELYAPALTASGLNIKNILVVRADQPLWSMEQLLRSMACRLVLTWIRDATFKDLRRLQLAAEQSKALALLVRPLNSQKKPSPAILRLIVQQHDDGLKIEIIKSRGGRLGSLTIANDASA